MNTKKPAFSAGLGRRAVLEASLWVWRVQYDRAGVRFAQERWYAIADQDPEPRDGEGECSGDCGLLINSYFLTGTVGQFRALGSSCISVHRNSGGVWTFKKMWFYKPRLPSCKRPFMPIGLVLLFVLTPAWCGGKWKLSFPTPPLLFSD